MSKDVSISISICKLPSSRDNIKSGEKCLTSEHESMQQIVYRTPTSYTYISTIHKNSPTLTTELTVSL